MPYKFPIPTYSEIEKTMSLFGLPTDYIDVSHGDPLFPFTKIWELAAAKSKPNLSTYNPNTYRSNLSLRYRDHLTPIQDYFHDRGFKKRGWSGVGLDGFLMLDGGASRAFHMLMQTLLLDVEDWNEDISWQNKESGQTVPPIRPVILMPVPTYGHFLREMKNGDGFKGKIECVPVNRDPTKNWAVDLNDLKSTLSSLTREGKRVIAYFDSNPNNPTGYVRGHQETVEIGNLLMMFSDHYERMDSEGSPSHSANFDLFNDTSSLDGIINLSRYHRRRVWDGPASRICMIDDMVYDGLQYEGVENPCSFSEALPKCTDWVTLTGPSKNGLASLRAGLAISANNKLIDLMRKLDESSGYCPSEITMSVLSQYFNNEAQPKKLREDYQRKASEYYSFAGQFMKAMVNGLPEVENEVSLPDIRRMRYFIKKVTGLSKHEATRFLDGGINGLKIITSPHAGFFHLLDGKDLIGKSYEDQHRRFSSPPKTFKDEWDMEALAKTHNLHIASGQYTGFETEKCIQRLTYALPPEKLVEVTLRLHSIANDCK